MSDFDREPDQEKRIEMMRAEIKKLGGTLSENPDMPADLEEAFLKQVLEYETAESTSVLQLLQNAGVEVPPPEGLDDTQLNAKLWEVINRMATLGAYLLNTNHLSDRALYENLYHDSLREEAMLFPENPGYAHVIDLVGSGSDEDQFTYLKYYADEDYRSSWAKDWPGDPMPEHEDPPFDRDRHLPPPPF